MNHSDLWFEQSLPQIYADNATIQVSLLPGSNFVTETLHIGHLNRCNSMKGSGRYELKYDA